MTTIHTRQQQFTQDS